MLYIIRGLQGSGKSSVARDLEKRDMVDVVLEIDDYWTDVYGHYCYVHEKRENSHNWLRGKVNKLLSSGLSIAVPEVFESIAEIKTYTDIASVWYNKQYKIIKTQTPWADNPSLLLERNLHGVPMERLLYLQERWEDHPEEEIWVLDEYCYS